nr:MAG TPA: hypothetical protein [Caudoviricetes sp.]
MAKWTEYTKKPNPTSEDEIMILDVEGNANKRALLSDVIELLSQALKLNRVTAFDGEGSYSEMVSNGLNITLNKLNIIGIGYASSDFPYPYIIFGEGVSPRSDSSGMIKFYQGGLWIGNCVDRNSSKIVSGTGFYVDFQNGKVLLYINGKQSEITGGSGGGTVDIDEIIEKLKPYIDEQIAQTKPVAVFG